MTIVAGTGVADSTLIQNTIASALKLPGVVESQPAPIETPKVEIPNVSASASEAAVATSVELPTFDDSEEQAAEEPAPVVPVDDESDLPADPGPKGENFKKLRGILKETRATKRQLEAELEEKRVALERFEKGEVVPGVIQAKDTRIQELEKFEKIHNLKTSDEYQERYVRPALGVRTKLEKYADDYGIPKEHVLQAVGIESEKDLNAYLGDLFRDGVAAIEVKQAVKELQQLGAQALEAEQEPENAWKALQEQAAVKRQEQREQRAKVFESVAKDGWAQALEQTQKEGVYKEFIPHPSDTEFNKKYVEPIQARASTQFGALIKQLHAAGMEELPPKLAKGLARMVQLSIGGALLLGEKAKAEQKVQQVSQAAKRINPLIRPSIGGNNGSAHKQVANAPQPMSLKDAARKASSVFK